MSAEFVERFESFWARPRPERLVEVLNEDGHLVQPMLPECHSRAAYGESLGRLLEVMPDLHGVTHRWASTDDGVFIEHTLRGTLGGKPFSWDLADRITLRDGKVAERIAYFDPLPIVAAVLTRPSAWLPFLRMRVRSAGGAHRGGERSETG